MRIIVFGATGGTGQALIQAAITAGHTVTAFTRRPGSIAEQPALRVSVGNVLDRPAVAAAVGGHDAVLSALGGRPWRKESICGPAIRNISAAMGTHQVRRIVAISTLGAADTRADVGWAARNILFRFILRREVADKEDMEEHLATTDLDWTVVRVGMLMKAAKGRFRVADDHSIQGMGKIARADVAGFMIAQLQSGAWVRRRPVIVY